MKNSKRIKGSYEEHLRNHESITEKIDTNDITNDFYYTAYNYPNNFLINLYYFDSEKYKNELNELIKNNDIDENDKFVEEVIFDCISLISALEAKKYSATDLRKIIIDKIKK